jgi:hypothetical protein
MGYPACRLLASATRREELGGRKASLFLAVLTFAHASGLNSDANNKGIVPVPHRCRVLGAVNFSGAT